MKNVLTILKPIGRLLAVMLPLLCACSQNGPRTIENPCFSSASPGVRILSVELTDSATFVKIHHEYMPDSCILWTEGTYAQVGSVRYDVIGGEGIEPGKKLWMDGSEESVYVLKFSPIPFSAKSMDIIDGGEEYGSFEILGIEFEGKVRHKQNPLIPVPAEPDNFPPFDETIAESTIRFHCLNNASARNQECMFVLEDMFGQNCEYFQLDENGYAEYSFTQRGSAYFSIGIKSWNVYHGYIAPGETVDVYFDAEALKIMRTGEYPIPVSSEGIRYSGSKGSRYDSFQNLLFPLNIPYYPYAEAVEAVKDYHISADDYSEMVDSLFTHLSDSLEAMDIAPAIKELNRTSLVIEALAALVGCNNTITDAYGRKNRCRPDFNVAVMDRANVEKFLSKHPVDRQKFLSLPGYPLSLVVKWMCDNDVDGIWLSELGQARELANKAKVAQLSEEDLAFEWNFLNEVLKSLQKEAEAYVNVGSDSTTIEKVSDFPTVVKGSNFTTVEKWDNAEDWLQSFLRQYKGKVVMIDLWNTSCGPCKSAIAANEPVKNSELNSDDIVWIYIADESSPNADYIPMIKDIRGVHIRLTKEQIADLRYYFNVDAIPYYILVDREGNYEGRPDLRDHKNYINAIKSLL